MPTTPAPKTITFMRNPFWTVIQNVAEKKQQRVTPSVLLPERFANEFACPFGGCHTHQEFTLKGEAGAQRSPDSIPETCSDT